MEDYEKLGMFYLGRTYDLASGKLTEQPLLYDSKDLVTHAVCVGMTGSGKTGLGIALLEEAAIDGVPAIVIDPKGDLANLLLTFPELRGEDFRPWINEAEAAVKGLSPEQYAEEQATAWREGLADWDQTGERIARLREAAEFAVYTPGSSAGLPVSILKSFAAPAPAVVADEELLRDRLSSTVTSLLGLMGVDADPLQSKEHILLSTILDGAWKAGRDLDLGGLIQQIQEPPVTRIGVMDLETFYPAKERFQLAMRLNNLLAAPGFEVWLEGERLDPGALLWTAEGRPRVAVFSIAHLDDAERMFFVSLLLNEVLAWVRAQPGTSSLRALLYMDEIFGFFPPVANPPSKIPLLTLLKQARAYGLGVVLATQNPVDLDYKGLANTGTWFIGRLQTERDKARVLEGLEGTALGTAAPFDRSALEQTLAGLGKRIFLLYNVHEDEPAVFQTRWVMSYLSGPMTRAQLQALTEKTGPVAGEAPAESGAPTMAPEGSPAAAPEGSAPEVTPEVGAPQTLPVAAEGGAAQTATGPAEGPRPQLPPGTPQVFVPLRAKLDDGNRLVYSAAALGAASVHYTHKSGIDVQREVLAAASIDATTGVAEWEEAQVLDLVRSDLLAEPPGEGVFGEVPAAATSARTQERWSASFGGWVRRAQPLELWESPQFDLVSQPGESEGEFRARVELAGREQRDAWQEELRGKYAAKLDRLEERIEQAEQRVELEAEQARSAKLQTAVSLGSSLLGAFLGRKRISASAARKAAQAARGVGRAVDQHGDVGRAQDSLEGLLAEKAELEAEFRQELESEKPEQKAADIRGLSLKPRKADVQVQVMALGWLPWQVDEMGGRTPAWR